MAVTQSELALQTATRAGHIAAQACADAAERHSPGWVAQAYAAFLAFAKIDPARKFTTEDVRNAAKDTVPPAPDDRAWGAIAQRAKRAGIVKAVGTRCVSSSNGSPKTLWLLNPDSP